MKDKNSQELLNKIEFLQSRVDELETFFNKAASLILSVDQNGIIVECNNHIASVLGYYRGEIVGQHMSKIIHPDYMAKAQKSRAEVIKTGYALNKEYKMVRKDSSLIYVNVSSSGINLLGNVYERTICIVSDITSRKEAEEELKALNQQLKASNQQLEASEQQLKASNQQLAASEQQLRASNQQLAASEQQIRTYNKQLELNQQKLSKSEHLLNEVGKIGKVGGWEMDMIKGGEAIWTKGTYDIVEIEYDQPVPGFHEHITWYLPDYQEYVKGVMDKFATDFKPMQYEAPFITAKGNTKWVRAIGEAVLENGKCIKLKGVILDITESRKSAEAITKSLESLHNAEKLAKLGSFERNWQTGKGYWSKGFHSLLGIEENKLEYSLKDFMEFIDKKDVERVASHIKESLQNKTQMNIEFLLNSADNTQKVIHGTAVNTYDKAGKPLYTIGTFQDVTESKKAENILKDREQALQSIIENPVGYMIYRLQAGSDHMSPTVTHVSPSIFDLIGISVEESSNYIKWFENVHPEDLPRLIEANQRGMKPPFVFDEEFRYNHPLKGQIWLQARTKGIPYENDKGNIEWAHGILMDITSRKLAEFNLNLAKELAEKSKFELKSIIDKSPFPIAVIDTMDEKIFLWSKSAIELFGHVVYLVSDWFKLAYPDPVYRQTVLDRWKLYLEEANKTKQPVYAGESKITCKNGKLIICEIYVTFIEKRLIITLNNVTNRIKVQEQLLVAKEKAEEADRLKSAFLANMSHEIRTPMNGILGFTSLLKEPNLEGDIQQKYIGIIQKSGNRMLNTINDIIEISKIETGQVKLVRSNLELNSFVESLCQFFKPEAEFKGLKFTFESDMSDVELFMSTDEVKLNSILTNLIKNAIKFTETGFVKISYSKKKDFFEFVVEDSGIGIAKERQEAVFNRFVQADIEDKLAHQGSGLGLAIAKFYVEMLRGEIWLESEVDVGSKLYFTIPVESDLNISVPNASQRVSVTLNENSNKLKVLIVEDDEVSSLHLSILIQDYVEHVKWVTNGKDAVEELKNDSSYDLVFMDIKMPVMNGYTALEELKKMNLDAVIVAQTAYALEGDGEKALVAGFDKYISKPIDVDILNTIVEGVMKTKN